MSSRLGDEFFKQVPKAPGVYLMYGLGGQVIYVGKAKDLRARLRSYRQAKPHQVSRKVVRLVHCIDEIRYEPCVSEQAALLRENELLRLHRPPFNVVNTSPESYYFIGAREWSKRPVLGRPPAIEFKLTANPDFGPDWETRDFFGAFKGRGLVRDGYQRLLRLLWSSQADLDRFEFPGQLCGRRVPTPYEWRLKPGTPESAAREWLALVQRFLRGTSDELLMRLTEELLFNSKIPPFYYRAIQEDLEALSEFFEQVPRRNHGLRVALGIRRPLIAQDELDDLIVLGRAARIR